MADLKALMNRFYVDVMSKGDLDALDELVADDFVEHEEVPGGATGKDGVRQYMQTIRDAFPDLQVEVVAMVAEGDEVWAHAIATGTHQGEFLGVPATGKSMTMPMIDRVKVKDGKAIAHWGVSDNLAMLTQLGVVPEVV